MTRSDSLTSTQPPIDVQSLSQRLRESTRQMHEHAENRAFVTDLMRGALGREAYTDLAIQHREIYAALENAGQRIADTAVGRALVRPELIRLTSLESDLHRLAGPGWSPGERVLPATRAYAARLGEVAATERGYLAHAYTRYLGDLSGGQVVRTLLLRHYDLSPEELTFYHFARIPKPKVFKDDFRAAMDALVFTEVEVDRILTEAGVAFALNAAVFDELGSRHPGPRR